MDKERIKVLLIEDNPDDEIIFKEMINKMTDTSFDMKWERNLTQGLEVMRSNDFDIVILDLGLPESEGIETFKKVIPETQSQPIIVLSGLQDRTPAIKAVEMGAQDYLVKGKIHTDGLYRSIRYAIERHQLQRELAEARLREQQENEFQKLDLFLMSPTFMASTDASANKHLREVNPELFNKMVDTFCGFIDNMLIDYNDNPMNIFSGALIPYAKQLMEVKADSYDVMDIFTSALRKKTKNLPLDKVQICIEDGRTIFIEIMMNLLSLYREHSHT